MNERKRLIERTDRTIYKVIKTYQLYGEVAHLVESPSKNWFTVLESSITKNGYFDLLESQEWLDAAELVAREQERTV